MRPADVQSAISSPTSAPHAPARPRPTSTPGSQSDHSIVSKSHADSHNPHRQTRSPLASLQVQWLLPVLRRTPASERDETPRMSSHTRKFLPKSFPHVPVTYPSCPLILTLSPHPSHNLTYLPMLSPIQPTLPTSTNPSESSSAGIP